ncbi:MAG: hypothetical protein ACQEP3_01985 [Patescibacteria group bacterium]
MVKTNKKHLLFIISSVAIITSSAFIITTLFLNLKKESDQYLNEKEELERITTYSEDLKKEDHQEIKAMLSEVNELFINPERPIEEILFLEKAAKQNNLTASIETGEKVEDSKPWPYLEFDLKVSGSFADLASFLKEVKEKKWIYSINKLSIEAVETQEEKRDISATLSLRAYFLDN